MVWLILLGTIFTSENKKSFTRQKSKKYWKETIGNTEQVLHLQVPEHFSFYSLTIASGFPVIVNTTRKVTGRVVVVAWEPPLDGTCSMIVGYTVYYREVMSLERKGEWHSVIVDRNVTSYTLHVNCGKEYDVAVTSRSGNKENNLSDSKIWNFKTAGGNVIFFCDVKSRASGSGD